MRSARALAVVTIVFLASVAAAGAGGATAVGDPAVLVPAGTSAETGPAAAAVENASLGAHLTSYLQSGAARTAGAAETGLWVAAYNAAPANARPDLIARGTDRIERRIAVLESRKQALAAARENGSVGPAAYRAQLSRIAGRLAALSSAIAAVEDRADEAGVSTDRLTTLRQRAGRLADEDVRGIARRIAGADDERGRPTWLESLDHGPSNTSERSSGRAAAGNRSSGPDHGPPDDRGEGSDGRSDAAPGFPIEPSVPAAGRP